MSTIIFDIDGTIADVEHRRHFVSGPKKDFNAFYDAMIDDTPIWPVANLMEMYWRAGHSVILCTGRPEAYRSHTEEWLEDYGFNAYRLLLLMRPDDRRFDPDYQVKQDMLYDLRNRGYRPSIAVDDRDQVVKMWREEGLTCFQVAEGNF